MDELLAAATSIYLNHRQRHQRGLTGGNKIYEKPAPFPVIPSSKWYLTAYVRDVLTRMDVLLAIATSSYDTILKTDSTKKICKKLQGVDANSASWMTNVGNEILMSVLTSSETVAAL